jgi:hypothetical protein
MSNQKLNQKQRAIYDKMGKPLWLLVAIAEKDKEKIAALQNVEPWNISRATDCYIHFLKGLAAYTVEDKPQAIYHFMYVKEHGAKIVFAKYAGQYLSQMQ